jgi:hypothetical protein
VVVLVYGAPLNTAQALALGVEVGIASSHHWWFRSVRHPTIFGRAHFGCTQIDQQLLGIQIVVLITAILIFNCLVDSVDIDKVTTRSSLWVVWCYGVRRAQPENVRSPVGQCKLGNVHHHHHHHKYSN